MNTLRAFWVPLVLLGTALVLARNPIPVRDVILPAGEPAAWVTNSMPVRQPSSTPEYTVATYSYRCSDCHRILPSPLETHRTLGQHTEVQLRHGLNTRCFNCHHRINRDAFVDDLGGEIPWEEPQRVCARCHGPVYRDWQAGSHGRVNGYWDRSRGEQTRRTCIECHDPHVPPFQPMAPAPGPQTLRMGPQEDTHEGNGKNPLRLSGTKRQTGTEH